MFHAALLATVVAAMEPSDAPRRKTALQACFETMDGAVYHGDPTDRVQMRIAIAACEQGVTEVARIIPTPSHGPQKLFLMGRILDRAATLSFMGLGDARTALREVRTANLYFRIGAALPGVSEDYRSAARLNVTLTRVQLQTLMAEPSISARPNPTALHRAQPRVTADADTSP